LLIVEVLTRLGPVVFPFTPEGFPRKKFWCLACGGCWIYFSALFLDELIFWC